MSVFRFLGLPAETATEVRATLRSPGYGHPVHRETATGYGPCRLCLRTFRTGQEDRLLFTYQPMRGEGALPAPGPVFIHAEPCERYDALELPGDLRALPMVIEGYSDGGWLERQEPVEDVPPERVIADVFATPGVDYVHLRNAEAGCFMARVERCFACD
ncbi:MAG TPA: DUF1203 domain-containing protein [Gemmatimonadales bacterium]|nr:DUF1203 domain-containing protein [Gemmatimonadales bacterium]